jgi:hypothetical protein
MAALLRTLASGLDECPMFVNRQSVACASFQRYTGNDDGTKMIVITDQQRRVLVQHAMECNSFASENGQPDEGRFADVIVDLATDRPVRDRGLLVSFLWQRVSLAVEAGLSRKDHWVWSAAVQLLDQLGEDLEEIFVGRSMEPDARGSLDRAH